MSPDSTRQIVTYSMPKIIIRHTPVHYKEVIDMSLINKEIGDFTVQAYAGGEFKTVTKADVLGKWSVFFFLSCGFTFVVAPQNLEESG